MLVARASAEAKIHCRKCQRICKTPHWFRAFLQKAMQVADNLVFIGLAPAWFVRARQEDMRQARFALVELCALPIPPDWPQFGIELTAGWARRGWQGAIAHTRLPDEPPGR
jgi:hypothetical protein